MKLRRLKLDPQCQYRSLEMFQEEKTFPKHPDFQNEIDPICLMGLNGCGKSNLLELLSDIFFIVDSFLLKEMECYLSPSYFPFANNRERTEIYFLIEYEINIDKQKHIVRISRNRKKKNLLVFETRNSDKNFELLDLPADKLRRYVPKVIAYTSGANELISLSYTEMQDNYGRLVTRSALTDTAQKFPLPKMMFLDYEINPAIVIANYLFANQEKLALFQRLLRVDTLDSFRIQIKTEPSKGLKPIELTDELREIIDKLVKCSTCYDYEPIEKKTKKETVTFEKWTLDFVVTEATKQAFAYYFRNAKELFYSFYKLNLLNTLCIKKDHRESIRRKRKQGIFMKFPTVSDLDKIFNISKVDLKLKTPPVTTEYMKISDGEHQFIHIVGGMLLFDDVNADEDYLFLMDEPDTHFNPYWRRNFFKELNKVVENKAIEIVITTHSPFIVSDCHGYNVFKFERVKNGSEVKFQRSHFETYAVPGQEILDELFFKGYEEIQSKAESDLTIITQEIQNIDNEYDLTRYQEKLQYFGSSIHKLHALVALETKMKQFCNK